MGSVTTVSHSGDGLYLAAPVFDTRRLDARLAQIDLLLTSTQDDSLNNQIKDALLTLSDAQTNYNKANNKVSDAFDAVPQDQQAITEALVKLTEARGELDKAKLQLDLLKQQKTALENEKAYLEKYAPEVEQINIWCADYTTDIADDTSVATCEINGERIVGQVIRPQEPPHNSMIGAINAHRLANSKTPLYPDYRLFIAAQRHAEDEAKTQAMSHNGSDGSTPPDRAEQAGYPVNRTINNIGENIGGGHMTGAAAVTAWQSSPGHNSIMLNDLFNHIGVGYYKDDDSGNIAWVAVFGYIDALLKEHDRGTPGVIQPAISSTSAAVFYNFAIMTGWQYWMPTYRIGTIKRLDKENGVCDLDLDFAESALPKVAATGHGVEINQQAELLKVPIKYMNCDACAFRPNDRVLIEFQGQNQNFPYVVGFESNPRPCGVWFTIYRGDGRILKPDPDLFVDVTLSFSADTINDRIGGGSWAGNLGTFNEGGQLSFDESKDKWFIHANPNDPRRPCRKVFLKVDATDAVDITQPNRYRPAEQFLPEDAIDMGTEIDLFMPFWRVDRIGPEQLDGTGERKHGREQITVYSSLSYNVTIKWGFKLFSGGYATYPITGEYLFKGPKNIGAMLPLCSDPQDQLSAEAQGTVELTENGTQLAISTPAGANSIFPFGEKTTKYGPSIGGRVFNLEFIYTIGTDPLVYECFDGSMFINYDGPFDQTISTDALVDDLTLSTGWV